METIKIKVLGVEYLFNPNMSIDEFEKINGIDIKNEFDAIEIDLLMNALLLEYYNIYKKEDLN